MSPKLIRPSLKNYLSTGKVRPLEEPTVSEPYCEEKSLSAEKLLEILAPSDLNTWEQVFSAGAEIKKEESDLVKLRDFFRTMDRVRFTLYILESDNTPLRTIRSGVQIRDPFVMFLLWDDEGTATLYVSPEREII